MGLIRRAGVRGSRVQVAVCVALASLAISAVAFATSGSRGWSIQHAPNAEGSQDSFLYGVSCSSKRACTAIGVSDSREALTERWNGTEWSIQQIPTPPGQINELNGVSCPTKRACTAVGSNDIVKFVTVAERWNGRKWSIQHTPNPAHSQAAILNGVSCTSERACIAVGRYTKANTSVTLAERWNGHNWKIQHTPNPHTNNGGSSLNAVACASKNDCTAVGNYHKPSNHNVTLAERWNGHNWKIEPTRSLVGFSQLNGVACTSASTCTAVGVHDHKKNGRNATGDKTLAESWNGHKWKIEATPNPTGAHGSTLLGIACAFARACTAVGGTNVNAVTLAERWDGHKWTIQATPNPKRSTFSRLAAVSCSSKSTCSAVGYNALNDRVRPLAEGWNGG